MTRPSSCIASPSLIWAVPGSASIWRGLTFSTASGSVDGDGDGALDAREQLRTAYRMFEAMGAAGFAARASRELNATGETARSRIAVANDSELTAQDAQIARMAADGLSNPDIGTRLFISAHTVQYHLRKVFAKLGISSRNQLERVIPRDRELAELESPLQGEP